MQGLSDYKRSDPSFLNLCNTCDIVLVCESWSTELSNIDITGFVEFVVHRPSLHRQAHRASGGVIIYVKSDIILGVCFLKKGPLKTAWIKLDINYFGFSSRHSSLSVLHYARLFKCPGSDRMWGYWQYYIRYCKTWWDSPEFSFLGMQWYER